MRTPMLLCAATFKSASGAVPAHTEAEGGGRRRKQVKLNLSALPALCHRCQLGRGSHPKAAAVRGCAVLPASGHGRARRAGDAPTQCGPALGTCRTPCCRSPTLEWNRSRKQSTCVCPEVRQAANSVEQRGKSHLRKNRKAKLLSAPLLGSSQPL